ncbi:Aspartic proteinase CDR1 [Linum grandiflorum]
MNISIGTPPFQILVIADTGSNVLWTKCSAFPNKGILFTPSLSSTYETMPCPSRVCDHRDGVVSTPLIYDPSRPLFFFLKLEAMSVGNVRIPFRGSASENQNILIDSGTVYTMLPNEFFSQLSSEVARQIVGRLRVGSPFSSFFKLCYELGPTGTINAPPITMNFVGADVELPLSNVFIQISDKVTCFAFLPRDDGFSIYGNFAQQNFLVGYDLHNNAVSFKPSNCGRK